MHEDRLFGADPGVRAIARRLYSQVQHAPILSPHGHTDPIWFAENKPFPDPAALLIQPDHYIFRMLYSQGISLESLGIATREGTPQYDAREIWRTFAQKYYLFRGTPTRLWLDFTFAQTFGLTEPLQGETADAFFDSISAQLQTVAFLPRSLYDRFGIELLATTDAATDSLAAHQAIRASGWAGRVIPTFRPDGVIDPEQPGFRNNLATLGEQTGEDTQEYAGYLEALRKRRQYFKENGATATDHGHRTAETADLSREAATALFARVTGETVSAADAALFRAHMLTVMAQMSLEDGLVMQLHPGSYRDHNLQLFQRFGKDKGGDIPLPTDYVHALRPLLNRFGNEPGLTLILFTLDETTYSRELAPLAGVYPCLRLGPSWWFHDSPEGMMRYREQTTETAGFYNTVGFNDDTRAFLSIPARHDVARRVDAAFLARLVAEHRLEEQEATEIILDLTTHLVRKTYRL